MRREMAEEINIEYLPLDLSSFQSTIEFVRTFKEKNLPLHILINNAAVYGLPYGMSCCFVVDCQANRLFN